MSYPEIVNHNDPAIYAASITPSDTVNMSFTTRGIYVGGIGDAVIVMQDDTEITFKNLASGTILPVRAIRVNATNTTATHLVALA